MKLIVKNAMILAAGYGKRMLPITLNIPKPLVSIGNKPLIFYIIEKLKKEKINKTIVNTHYLSEKFYSILKKKYPKIKVLYEKQILETGGGVLNALNLKYISNPQVPLLVINGDIFWIEKNKESLFSKLFKYWDDNIMDILIVLQEKKIINGYKGKGDFDFLKRKGNFGKLVKRKKNDFVFCGVQIIHPRIFTRVKKKKFSLRELYLNSMSNGRLYGITDKNLWFHISTPEDLKNVNQWLIKNELYNL